MSIVIENKYLTYKISDSGQNEAFIVNGLEDRIIKGPAVKIISRDKTEIYPVSAVARGDILEFKFENGTVAEIICAVNDEYVTFTLKSVSNEDFHAITFVNVSLTDGSSDYQAVMIGMTLSTHMKEHPGDNRNLVASAYPHIGLFSTNRSPYPAKAGFFVAPTNRVREIERKILDEIPDGEVPKSRLGGPYSDTCKDDARGDYFILMTDTATLDNVDKIVEDMKKLGLTQVNLHHFTHYRQGDFKCLPDKFPNGVGDFRAVVDAFHSHGMKVGLQTYSFFVVPTSSYVSPIPHKDLEIMREFTLSEDISDTDNELFVCESTEGVNNIEGFVYTNSPYLWIDDELIKFSVAENGRFTVAKRGEYGTVPAPHKKGSSVKQLKQYFLLPFARVGSELFYEIARKTAEFYNESGADMFYLDALDGTFVLDGDDYVWYHAMDFVREMFKYLKRDIIFNCCYNPQYTGTWFVRSRYGAVDVSLNAHRRYIDAHVNYNKKTAERMGVVSELGWIDLFPRIERKQLGWQCDTVFEEDLEYICAKAFATGASISFLESFIAHKDLPIFEKYSELLKKYSLYRAENKPTAETKKYLEEVGNGAVLKDGALYRSCLFPMMIEQGFCRGSVNNPFTEQIPTFRIESMRAGDSYDSKNSVLLCDICENEPISNRCIRFEKPVSSNGNRAVGVWCKGDGSGALITINLRNFAINKQKSAEYYIKADFVGWRYFAFYKAQNGILPTDIYPMKELEYTTYTQLQDFYGYYRINFDFDAIDGVDITVKGSDKIYMKPIRMVSHIEPTCKNPTLHFGNTSIKIFTEIPAECNLYFDGRSCVLTDENGNVLDRPMHEGTPILSHGENEIILQRESKDELSRIKLTVGNVGEILQ